MKNRLYIITLLFTVLFAGFLIGCSTAPKKTKTTEVKQSVKQVSPIIKQAETLLKTGSYSSIIDAVKKIKAGNLLNEPEGSEVVYLSKKIYKLIYPELEGKFPSVETITYAGKYKKYFDAIDKNTPFNPLQHPEQTEPNFFESLLPAMILVKKHHPEIKKDYLEKLEKSLRSTLGKTKNSVITYYLIALADESLKKKNDEIAGLKKSISVDNTFYPAKIKLARIYLKNNNEKKENLEEAAELLTSAAATIPPNTDILKMLAETYFNLKDYSKAETSSANALLLDPKREDLILLRAKILKAAGKWQQAFRMYNLALKFNPKQRDALLYEGEILFYNENNLAASLAILNNGEKAYPDDPAFPEFKGRILLQAGKDNEGLKELNKALKIQPGRISTLRMLLQNSISMKRWIQGAMYLSQILEKSKSEEDLKLAYTIFKNLGDSQQALTYAEKLYKLGKEEEYTGFYIEQLYANGKEKDALRLIKENLPKLQNKIVKSNLYLYRAEIIEKSDQNGALTALRKSLMLYPDNLKAIVKISQLYSNLHMYRRAGLYLKHAVYLDPNNPGLKIQLQQVQNLYTDMHE